MKPPIHSGHDPENINAKRIKWGQEIETFRINYRCMACGSFSLYWDGSHYWDPDTQSFQAGDDVGDGPFCGDCGAAKHAEPVDIETGAVVAEHPAQPDVFISVEDARHIKERQVAEREALRAKEIRAAATQRRAIDEAQAWAANMEFLT